MKVLDLFSGLGGFSLGLERAGFETVAFCEIEKYPRKILNKHWPNVPIFEDVRKLTLESLNNEGIESIELVCGGFPCQPFSVAGKQSGKEDNRHLWPEMFRIIKEVRPRWVIGENVAGFINMALDDVLLDLENEGYETQTFVIPACAIGGIHRRDRVWICANSNDSGRNSRSDLLSRRQIPKKQKRKLEEDKQTGNGRECRTSKNGDFKNVPDSSNKGLQGGFRFGEAEEEREPIRYNAESSRFGGFFRNETEAIRIPIECSVRHRDDGLPDNVARLKALGNAVVPQIPEIIGRAIMEIENGS